MLKDKISKKPKEKSVSRPEISRVDWYKNWKKVNEAKQHWQTLADKLKKKRLLEALTEIKRGWRLRSQKRSQSQNGSGGFKILKLVRCSQPLETENTPVKGRNSMETAKLDDKHTKTNRFAEYTNRYYHYTAINRGALAESACGFLRQKV